MSMGTRSAYERFLPLAAVVVHTAAVSLIAYLLYRSLPVPMPVTDDVRIVWGMFLVIDFPSSLLAAAIWWAADALVQPASFGVVGAVAISAAAFAVCGGAHYYGLAKLVLYLRRRSRERRADRENRCVKCGHHLPERTAGSCPVCGSEFARGA